MTYLFQEHLDNYKNLWFDFPLEDHTNSTNATLFKAEDTPTTKVHVNSNYAMSHKIFGTLYSNRKQKNNDKELLVLKKKAIKWIKSIHKSNKKNSITNFTVDPTTEQNIKNSVIEFLSTTMGLSEEYCHLLDQYGYYDTTKTFISRAKELIPTITYEETFQALRNLWVIISLQIYMGVDVTLTDAAFGYSMLYPLTDNYLDNPSISNKEKTSFNKRFYNKIKNNDSEPINDEEALIFSMIDLIENNFPRESYPLVYKSLLAILDAQDKSLIQQGTKSLNDQDLLNLTFYKGGSSVLADAYLVKGFLSDEEANFAYGYGVLLQIADDLQDMKVDETANHITMANTEMKRVPIDGFFQHYIHFTDYIISYIYTTKNKQQTALKALLLVSIESLLFSIVTEHEKHFTPSYVRRFKQNYPFSAKGYKRKNQQLKKRFISLLGS